MTVHDYRKELERLHGQVWDHSQLTDAFDVHSYSFGLCYVTRKSDGVKGTVNFLHLPRFYFNFKAD